MRKVWNAEEKLQYERALQAEGCTLIAGVDEAGRGPLAGPVCAAAVILPSGLEIPGLNDSKKLTDKRRRELFPVIKENALAYAIALIDEKEIDEINILQATYEAMRLAIENLKVTPDILFNDAVTIPGVDILQVPIVKGDAKSQSIAAASIMAKVTRDRLCIEDDRAYPQYEFAKHKGYGTKLHYEMIEKYGVSKVHRRTFLKKILGE